LETLHIRVKVKPVTISENGDAIPDQEKMFFIDLGDSKIISE
jgi:hypothetical protein